MKRLCLVLLILIGIVFQASAQSNDNESNLPLPRWASFRHGYTNARSGPGSRYPIEWVYKQKNAPVEIIAEYDMWRRIRDWDGSESWAKAGTLNNARWIKITHLGTTDIYAKPQSNSRVIARVEDQVIGKIEKCPKQKDFCLIKFAEIEGWVERKNFYGVSPDEVID